MLSLCLLVRNCSKRNKSIFRLVCSDSSASTKATTLSRKPITAQSILLKVNSLQLKHYNLYCKMTALAENAKFKLTEIEGDLFSAPATHSLAHCVGADLTMGAGIAVKFKQVYGKVNELKEQGAQSGGVAVLQDKQRFIYYLVTKEESWGRPTYESLRSSLMAMREHMQKNNVHNLAIPRIGCGIDGLEWDKVSSELKDVFEKENLEIVVYNFVPK